MTPNEQCEQFAENLVEHLLGHKEISEFAAKIARDMSGTTEWSEQDWEQNEEDPRYMLYWECYASVHTKIIAIMNNKLTSNLDSVDRFREVHARN